MNFVHNPNCFQGTCVSPTPILQLTDASGGSDLLGEDSCTASTDQEGGGESGASAASKGAEGSEETGEGGEEGAESSAPPSWAQIAAK